MEERQMLREYVPQSANQSKLGLIRRQFEQLAYFCKNELPEGREKSLALTNLEQASMWAVKAETHQLSDANSAEHVAMD